ncbi:two-partner secretion domain-containing protein [Ramlibacter humi]|nr:filamentous hemagglutinin N-terminal domain-containing protein [Ramlibacter humi]
MTRRQFPQRLRAGQVPAPAPAAAGHRPVLLALALAAGFTAVAARAQSVPIGAIHGTARFDQNGNNLVVTTTNGANSNHSAINWQSFNVPGGSTTYFNQPNAASTSINRVLGADPSKIFGTLSSNGKLVLVNPNGIAVGAGAVVDTAGFTASTLRMSDADAIAGRLRFGDGTAGGPLRVDGRVLARQGNVVLIGSDVQVGAGAVVESPAGATVLAAGQKVEVTGRGLEGIFFEVQAPTDQAVNLGTLRGDAVGVFAGTLRHSGLVQATGVTVEGGRVVLKASEHAETSGTTLAQGMNGAGGKVDVLARTVGVMDGAAIDTSNTAGGGQIRIGGDYRGASAGAPNAQVTYVAEGATLRANATDSGNGGRVIVWADDTTRVHGTIEAKGGANGGNGGFVETSGKRVLQASGVKVDASAAKGANGAWLLDPADITIVAGGAEDATSAGAPNDVFSAGAAGTSYLLASTLDAALNGGGTNVTIETNSGTGGTGDITFDTAAGSMTFNKTTGGTTNLNLNADGAIKFVGAGSVDFQATDGGTGVLNVNFNTAAKSVFTDGPTTVTASTGGPGNAVKLNLTSGTTWQNNGSLYLRAGSKLAAADATFANNGYVELGDARFLAGTLTNGGSVMAYGSSDLETTQGYASAGSGSLGFYGGNLTLVQQTGALVIKSSDDISASGAVSLTARGGDIQVNRDVHGASIGLDASGNIAASGSSFYTGGSTTADGPGVSLKAGGNIDFNSISTRSSSGKIHGGHVGVEAGNNITGYSIDTSSGSLGSGGGVSLIARGTGAIDVGYVDAYGSSSYARGGDGGAVSMTAGGNIHAYNIGTYGGDSYSGSLGGGNGGLVSLTSQFGNVTVDYAIGTEGGGGSGAGGNANGVSINAAGTAQVGSIHAYGGDGGPGRAGGNGGNVSVTASAVSTSYVDVSGGQGGSSSDGTTPGGMGGNGGSVTLVQKSGDLDLSSKTIYAAGGTGGGGYSGSAGGKGGAGGAITLVAQGGGVVLDPSSSSGGFIAAFGGQGGYSSDTRGGDGGQGGAIVITAAASSKLLGSLDASGGEGGEVDAGRGGNGGNGGSININVAGTLTLAGDVLAGAGHGGTAYTYDATVGDYVPDPARAGSNGSTWGTFSTSVSGGIVVPSTMTTTTRSTPPPSGPPALAAVMLAAVTTPTSTTVPAQLYVDAQWTNNDALTLQSGSTVLLGRYDHTTGGLSGSGQALVNGPQGTIQGTGTIDGSVANFGTVAPGGQGGIGRLVVTGDYSQGSTGFLRMDVAGNTTYVPGQTYDQLVVGGTANLGGQLVVSSLPAVPTSTVALATARQMVAVSDAPTSFYELIQASAATGRFSRMSGPSAIMAQMRMNIGGQVIDIPGGTAAGLIAALQQLLPNATLADLQQVLVETTNNSLGKKDDKEEQAKKGDDIVVTDTSCKPS